MKSNTELVYPTPGYSFCFQMTRDRKLHYHWHHHAEYEFTVCRNGSGEAHAADMIHSFKHPAAFFIAPRTDHALVSRGNFDGWIIQIPPLVLNSYEGRPEFRFLTELIRRADPALLFSDSASEKIAEDMERAQTRSGVFRWTALLDAFYTASTDENARLFSFQPERLGERNRTKGDALDEIINHLFNNFGESHSLAHLARTVKMPVQTFCRYFKKRTGMTVVEYLHSVRINTAKKLLQQSKLYVDDICYEVGFNSVSFFNRKFKARTGMTPVEYRRLFGGTNRESAG
jgi:AraC-like DNA-binding protein